MNKIKYIFIVSICVALASCEKYEKPAPIEETEIVLKDSAGAIVSGGWRRMGEFFTNTSTVRYLFTIADNAYFSVNSAHSLTSAYYRYNANENEFYHWQGFPKFESDNLGVNTFTFTVGDKGYLGVNIASAHDTSIKAKNYLFEYDPTTDLWKEKAAFPKAVYLAFPCTFSIKNKAYVCSYQGSNGLRNGDYTLYEFDPNENVWSEKDDVPYDALKLSTQIAFSINDKAYWIASAQEGFSLIYSVYEYSPDIDKWTKKANAPIDFEPQVSYTLGNKGYLYMGNKRYSSYTNTREILEYDPKTDIWNYKNDFTGTYIGFVNGFTIGSKAYIGFGKKDLMAISNELWEYNP